MLMKIKEGWDIYVTDEMLALVYNCASPVIQDAIDLAYLTGQHPADVLKMRWDQIKDGSVWVEQGKIKARLQIGIVGELSALLERIKSRGVVGMTLLCDRKGQKWLRLFEQQSAFFKWNLCWFSRCQFNRRQHHGISLIRCFLAQARMRPGSVVPIHVLHD